MLSYRLTPRLDSDPARVVDGGHIETGRNRQGAHCYGCHVAEIVERRSDLPPPPVAGDDTRPINLAALRYLAKKDTLRKARRKARTISWAVAGSTALLSIALFF